MKTIIRILFSLFFAIAIGVHIYYLYEETDKQVLWHTLYFITYGTCWAMLLVKIKSNVPIYAMMAVFPFVTHAYFGYNHFPAMDIMFWICAVVCVFLVSGFLWIKKENGTT